MIQTPLRSVAILDGMRKPFARQNAAYAEIGNLEMRTSAVKALVDKYGLNGGAISQVAAGAIIKHARDWNLAREALPASGLDPHMSGYDV